MSARASASRRVDFATVGALSRIQPADALRALQLVRHGRIYDLEITRFPRMPGAAGHVPLEVRVDRRPGDGRTADQPGWGAAENPELLQPITEILTGSLHTGTHIDALSHYTRGPEHHWFGGTPARENLSDSGPRIHDAAALPPVITRGVLLDVPAALGLDLLPAGYGISPADLEVSADAADVTIQPNDAVLVRTGWMQHWPDRRLLDAHAGAGLTESGARWLHERGAVLMGSDTPAFEQVPSAGPGPRVVHPLLLIELGVPIIELAYLEELASDRVSRFALFVSPLKISGGTASMVRPLAVV